MNIIVVGQTVGVAFTCATDDDFVLFILGLIALTANCGADVLPLLVIAFLMVLLVTEILIVVEVAHYM